MLGEEFFHKAIDKSSITPEEDWQNIHKLTSYNNNADLAFIYSSIKKDGKVYLTSSSASEEELDNKTEIHYFYHFDTAGEALVNSFETKKMVYENHTDEWGSFRAVHIPVTLDNLHTVVVSAEITMDYFNNTLEKIRYKYFFESIFYLLITLPIIVAVLIAIKEKVSQNIEVEKRLMKSEKMAAMGEMIGNIAHQWRQPLNVISTGATGLKLSKEYDNFDDENFIKTCDSIYNNAQYLSKTIDDFRDFIKGDRKKVRFNLTEDINSFFTLVEGVVKNNDLILIKEFGEDIVMEGYPSELIQCFINIFNNAKDSLKDIEDDKYIFISAKLNDNSAVITFKDNAGGIPENILPHIFEPYFTTKHKSQGTGLGLSMTYNLITNGMKGTIEADNVSYKYEGKEYTGARFKIILPLG